MEGDKPQFDYKKELTLLGEAILACDEAEVLATIDRLGRHIYRLELTVKKQHKQITENKKENDELKRQCAFHFANAQKVLRHELKLEERVLTTKGKVHGTGEEFELAKK